MTDWMFETPGHVDQRLPAKTKRAWHEWQAREARRNVQAMLEAIGSDAPSSLPYANPAREAVPADRETLPVDWQGFPEFVEVTSDHPLVAVEDKGYDDLVRRRPGERIVARDKQGKPVDCRVRHRQDEYVEWEATVDDRGKLESVTFVAEGYDYWSFLFEHDPVYVRDAYRERCRENAIRVDDLRVPDDVTLYRVRGNRSTALGLLARRGDFNPRNQLNQGPGIVHLSHRANSLSAEVNLAVTSALPRRDRDHRLVEATDPRRLLCCTSAGEPNRASDPRIAGAAYDQVTRKEHEKRFTLTNPVGLYIQSYDLVGDLRDPDGNEVERDAFWTVERGENPSDPADPRDSRILRVRVQSPESYALGDMFVGTTPITKPGQLARLIQMHLMVDLWAAPPTEASLPCDGSCCIDEQEILYPYIPPESCASSGLEDAFPGLLSADARAALSRALIGGRRMP